MKLLLIIATFLNLNISYAIEKPVYKTYESSVEGLENLMSDLKKSNINVHNQLESDFSKIKSDSRTASIIRWTTTIGGIGYAISSILSARNDSDNDEKGNEIFSKFGIGMGVFFAGYIASGFIEPSRQDYMNFINKHNEINPDNQLQYSSQLSLNPVLTDKNYGIQLGYNF